MQLVTLLWQSNVIRLQFQSSNCNQSYPPTLGVHGRKGRQTVLSPIYRFVCVVELERVEDIQASDLDVWVHCRWLLLLFCCLKSKHQGLSNYDTSFFFFLCLFLQNEITHGPRGRSPHKLCHHVVALCASASLLRTRASVVRCSGLL